MAYRTVMMPMDPEEETINWKFKKYGRYGFHIGLEGIFNSLRSL